MDLPLFQKVFQTNQDCTFLTARRQKRTCDKSHNNEAWWKLLGETVTKYKIKEENTDTTDEVGIQAQGGGECEYVFGSHKKLHPTSSALEHVRISPPLLQSVWMAQACHLLLFSRGAPTRSNGGKTIPLMHGMSF